MPQIASQTISITISKLVKNTQDSDSVLDNEQLLNLLETLPGVVEQLLDDASLVIEAGL